MEPSGRPSTGRTSPSSSFPSTRTSLPLSPPPILAPASKTQDKTREAFIEMHEGQWSKYNKGKKASLRKQHRKNFPDQELPDFMQPSNTAEKIIQHLKEITEEEWENMSSDTKRSKIRSWRKYLPDEERPEWMKCLTLEERGERKVQTNKAKWEQYFDGLTEEKWKDLPQKQKDALRAKWRKYFGDQDMPEFMKCRPKGELQARWRTKRKKEKEALPPKEEAKKAEIQKRLLNDAAEKYSKKTKTSTQP